MRTKTLILWLLLSVTIPSFAYDFQSGDLCYNITSDSTVEVTRGNYSELTSVIIPETVTYNDTTYSVTSIGSSAFMPCSGLTSITIPNSVTTIGIQAFYYCSGLTSITIPNSVTSIGGYAFSYCTSLTSIIIPNSVTSIGKWAFGHCTSLTSVILPNTVTNLGGRAFYNTPWYDNWYKNQPDGVIYINNTLYAYKGTMPQETSVVVREGTTRIGCFAFSDSTGLTSITIPNSVTTIEESAFSKSSLTSIIIPNSVTTIERFAFYYCFGLTSITIPNSVTTIEESAFSRCSGLTSITIPNSVTTIGASAFSYCTSLTSITIPNSVTSIGAQAFLGCSGLMSVVIPNSVTSIEQNAFSGCTGLTSVVIGNSVTSIDILAFGRCKGLTSVTCYAIEPPTAYKESFRSVNIDSIPLYVPAESVEKYKAAKVWQDFKEILPIGAMPVEADEPILEPDENKVIITWPAADGAATYTIEISKDEELVCTLTFDANGVLQSMRFAAPARYATQHTTQAQATGNGFRFVVEGLDCATTYAYSITATDKASAVLTTYTGTFTTKSPEGIEDVLSTPAQPTVRKVFRDGQVYIICGGKTYTLQGAEVK